MITVTSVEAQNRFGQLLDTVQREPVIITRYRRTAAFMVSPQDTRHKTHKTCKPCRRRATASGKVPWRRLRLGANGRLPAAAELTNEDVVRMVKESR